MNHLTYCSQEQLLGHSGNTSSTSEIGVQFKHLHVLLSLILDFGDALLQDLLAMYTTVRLHLYFNCINLHCFVTNFTFS